MCCEGEKGKSMTAISVSRIGKGYPIYKNKLHRLAETMCPFWGIGHDTFRALDEVTFRVDQGETLGIIGENGAGKSTLLRILAGIVRPDRGDCRVEGRISTLLELGAGFDPECTGLENLRMQAALLGFSKSEINERRRAILEFADIGDFIRQPVKTYSSGMMVRLAFAIAVSAEPDVLIIDEALAVGDIFFQAKCFAKLKEYKNKGTTIVFVSHDLISVKKLCDRVIWLEKGKIREEGEAGMICEKYLAAGIAGREHVGMASAASGGGIKTGKADNESVCPDLPGNADILWIGDRRKLIASGTGEAEIEAAFFIDADGKATRFIHTGQPCCFTMVVRFRKDTDKPLFGFELENVKGDRVYGVNNYMVGKELPSIKKGTRCQVSFRLDLPRIHSGEYLVTPAVASGIQEKHVIHDRLHNFDTVTVENEGYDMALIELEASFAITALKEEPDE